LVVIILHREKVTQKDVIGFKPEWVPQWEEWVVIHDLIPYDSYDDLNEAKRVARLLRKTDRVLEEINTSVDTILSDLSDEELEFLKRYVGYKITIRL